MAFARGRSSNLIDLIGDIDLEYKMLSYYFNINRIPILICSPIRQDHTPSFHIYSNYKGRVKWRDYGSRESGDIWNLLSEYWHLPINKVLERIQQDIHILKEESDTKVTPSTAIKGKIVHSEKTDLQVRVRKWKKHDIEYWESYGISQEWAIFGDIYPISHIIIRKGTSNYTIPADKYAYVYMEFKDNVPTPKIYQPFSHNFKWTNKHDKSVWDLWTKLPNSGETLIITSSRKDALCIWENTGIPSVSLQSEGYLPKATIVEELKHRFKTIYVLYDNDFRSDTNYGREYGKNIAETYNLTQIEIPTRYHKKDASDLCRGFGRGTIRQVIFDLIKNKKNIGDNDVPF